MCHAGHDVAPVDPATLKNVPPRSRGGPGSGAAAPDVSDDAPGAAAYPTLCECGFRNSCKRLSTLSEFLENASVEPAAATLHRFARRIIAKGHTRQLRTALAFCRHFAARTAWTGPTLAGAVSERARETSSSSFLVRRVGAVLHDLVDIFGDVRVARAGLETSKRLRRGQGVVARTTAHGGGRRRGRRRATVHQAPGDFPRGGNSRPLDSKVRAAPNAAAATWVFRRGDAAAVT